MFVSPEPRCGKSTGLALIYRTGPRTTLASNISAAAVYRYVESLQPTLLLDEAETFITDNEDLRGILNSGHTRDTAHVIRLVGDDYKPREFSTWAPKALASIGKLAATLRDRAIVIPMRRRKRSERVAKLRAQDSDEFAAVRRRARRWADDNVEELKTSRPALPDGLNDRAQDNWEPLLAIAELASRDWPVVARKAALGLTNDLEEGSIRVQLLADIKRAFVTEGTDRIASVNLAARLALFAGADEDAGPWGVYGKSGKPITSRQIARLLAEFSISPHNMRLPTETGVVKGYLREQFLDAFERYLSAVSETPSTSSATPLQTKEDKGLDEKQSATSDLSVADRNEHKSLNGNDCSVVADLDLPRREKGVLGHICRQCRGRPDGKEEFCVVGDEAVWLHPECRRHFETEARKETRG